MNLPEASVKAVYSLPSISDVTEILAPGTDFSCVLSTEPTTASAPLTACDRMLVGTRIQRTTAKLNVASVRFGRIQPPLRFSPPFALGARPLIAESLSQA